MLRLWLTVLDDGADRLTMALPPRGSWMVGRDESMNELVLHDAAVSRLHARLVFQEDRYMLQDVHSKAGSFVNGERVEGMVRLSDGDAVRFGRTELRVTLKEWTMAEEDEHTETLLG